MLEEILKWWRGVRVLDPFVLNGLGLNGDHFVRKFSPPRFDGSCFPCFVEARQILFQRCGRGNSSGYVSKGILNSYERWY